MAGLPWRVLGNGPMANGTQTVLSPPDSIELCASPRCFEHFLAPAELKIFIPSGVMRIGGSFDLDVSNDGSVRFLQQGVFLFLTARVFYDGGKHPSAGSLDFEVSILDPSSSFSRMSPCCPFPE